MTDPTRTRRPLTAPVPSLPGRSGRAAAGRPGRRAFLLGAAAISASGLMAVPAAAAPARPVPLRPAPAEPGAQTCALQHPTSGQATLVSAAFQVGIDRDSGGVHTLRHNGDTPTCTNYVLNPSSRPAFDIDDSRWLGEVVLRVDGQPRVTSLSDDIREVVQVDERTIEVRYRGGSAHTYGIRGFDLVETYRLAGTDGEVLEWGIVLTNTGPEPITVQDLGVPLLMASWWDGGDQTGIYEQNVGRHSFVGGDGSYIQWQRPNGEGPFLVLTPQPGTSLEFKDKARPGEGPFAEKDPSWEGLVEYFVHSALKAPERERQGKAARYLPSTSVTIEPGQSAAYGFAFRWAADQADMHRVLFEAGVVDVVSLPGMTIPADMTATLAVRAADGIESVTGGGGIGPEGEDAQIEEIGESGGYRLFRLAFPSRGPNAVTVTYGGGRRSVLQYASIDPVEELITAHAAHLAERQQADAPDRGYDGAFLQWDMRTAQRVTRQNVAETAIAGIDEFRLRWMTGGSDDLGLSPAAFLALKCTIAPDAGQVAALDRYIDRFLLGYLQNQIVDGERTWNVYHWYDGGDGERPATGREDGSGGVGDGLATWRVMNCPHVWNTYHAMSKVARANPELTARTAEEYLDFAYRTVVAYFEHEDAGRYLPDASREMASMGELSLPLIRDDLAAAGRTEEAARLDGYMAAKYQQYASRAYPFASEMSIDTTAFESVYTLSREQGDEDLVRRTTLASLAARGTQPLWYFFGGDNRHMGESWWNLGYETQLGAWQQQSYLENYDPASHGMDPTEVLRSTYGAYLAGWANINTGQISDDPANHGAASWQFQSEKGATEYAFIPNLDGWWAWSGEASLGFWGALCTATVDVVEDPIVGPYAYGGELTVREELLELVPRDGVRRRATFFDLGRFGFDLAGLRYSRAEVQRDLSRLVLTVEATATSDGPTITLRNLPEGSYSVSVDGRQVHRISPDSGPGPIGLDALGDGELELVIERSTAAARRA